MQEIPDFAILSPRVSRTNNYELATSLLLNYHIPTPKPAGFIHINKGRQPWTNARSTDAIKTSQNRDTNYAMTTGRTKRTASAPPAKPAENTRTTTTIDFLKKSIILKIHKIQFFFTGGEKHEEVISCSNVRGNVPIV